MSETSHNNQMPEPQPLSPHDIHPESSRGGETLSAEQIERLHSAFSIELYLGTHGVPLDRQVGRLSVEDLPTQKEYDEAAALVDSMSHRDVLFIERYGYHAQRPEIDQGSSTPSELEKQFGTGEYGFLVSSLLDILEAQLRPAAERALEAQRRNCEISAWEYADYLATFKNVQVFYADQTAQDEAQLQRQFMAAFATGNLSQVSALADGFHASREIAARDTVIDWALRHLPPRHGQVDDSEKRRLVLLFGAAHKAGLEQAFKDIGLSPRVVEMESSTMEDRILEQSRRMVADMIRVTAAAMMRDLGNSALGPIVKERPNGLQTRRPPFSHGKGTFGPVRKQAAENPENLSGA